LARTAIRFGLGRSNTEGEVDYVIEAVIRNVAKLREMSSLYQMKGKEPSTVGGVLL
jgi:cysteine desulfurase